MFDWPSLFRAPNDAGALDDWFDRIAARLLLGSRLLIGRQAHRLVEMEIYYWSKTHADPFTHRDPIQFHIGHWYFHRTHGVYRGGSFKGLDLTFGDGDTSGGVLIRGLETPSGTLIDGPSLCVDYLLVATGTASVAELDRAIDKRLAWESGNPLGLQAVEASQKQAPLRSPRVGLSLKRAASSNEATRFLLLPYRYLTEPSRTKKGKIHMVLALHAQGVGDADIGLRTNCPRRAVERYVADFEKGRKKADFAPYFGIDLGPSDLCKLYGVWFSHWGFSGK
jgi:3-methyladenine DNA glycosylase Mpg